MIGGKFGLVLYLVEIFCNVDWYGFGNVRVVLY